MSLLQDPLKALDQVEWYLENTTQEMFPGAFFGAAGNLCRSILEQILFVLAVYGDLPTNRFMKTDRTLRTSGQVLPALRSSLPGLKKTYLDAARQRGARVQKFARWPRSLDRWRRLFNEPSHFRNPAARARTKREDLAQFVGRMRQVFDDRDHSLVLAAMNQVKSGGQIRAGLANDPDNSPTLEIRKTMRPRDLIATEHGVSFKTPSRPIRFLPKDQEIPIRWDSTPVLLQGMRGYKLRIIFLAEDGRPIDLSSSNKIVESLARLPGGRQRVERRLKKLGFSVSWSE